MIMEKIKINYDDLRKTVASVAEKDLKTLSSGSMRLFAMDVRTKFKQYITDYSERVYRSVRETVSEDNKSAFLNLKTGYLIMMTEWMYKNEMKLPDSDFVSSFEKVSSDDKPNSGPRKRKNRNTGAEYEKMSGFELLVEGLCLVLWVPIRLVNALYDMMTGRKSHNRNVRAETKAVNTFRENVSAYVQEVTDNALAWAEEAENYSNMLLKQYDVC